MSPSRAKPRPSNGALILAGHGIRVAVERGHLVVEDGVGADRRRARFHRADRALRRLVVLGHAGTVSLDALRWLADVGAGFVQLDTDGKVIAAAGPIGLDDARLRRAQALAAENGRGLAIAKTLVGRKLTGQRALLDRLPGSAASRAVVERALGQVEAAATSDRLRVVESEAARAYWQAWSEVEVRFAQRDAKRVPEHWTTFGRRVSLVTGAPRKATNPANAILNYLYAIAEAEGRLAALAVGLDPGMGILHADQRARDSLACDLMEPVRPVVDAWVLDLLQARVFRRADFFETREGACRVMPPLSQRLAETGPRWAGAVAPYAERMARQLLAGRAGARSARRLPTPLTQANRSAARKGIRKRGSGAEPKPARMPRACAVCGMELAGRQRTYCPECRGAGVEAARSEAQAALRARRSAGTDPAHGGHAAKRRGRRNSAALRANAAWERDQQNPADPEWFAREIQPRLAEVPVREIMRATGLSQPYCAMIRRGERVPHPRHWARLGSLNSFR